MDLVAGCLFATNSYNNIEGEVMRVTLLAHTCIHSLLPLFDMLYMDIYGRGTMAL
jgi:hypothetical protein